MISSTIKNTTKLDTRQLLFEWKIENWSDVRWFQKEFRSGTFKLPGTDVECYLFFSFDAKSLTTDLTANPVRYLIGLCCSNETAAIPPNILIDDGICSLTGRDEEQISRFTTYSPSYYTGSKHRVLSLMVPHHEQGQDPLNDYAINDSLTILLKLKYCKVENVAVENNAVENNAVENNAVESNAVENNAVQGPSVPISVDNEEPSLYNLLVRDYRVLYEEQRLFDVTFSVEDEEIKAHLTILIAVSRFYLNFFTDGTSSHSWKLVEGVRVVKTLHRRDPSPVVFRGFLDFVYGVKKIHELKGIIFELLTFSHRYEVKMLKDSCERYLAKRINEKNVVEILRTTHACKCELLTEAAMKYAKNNLTPVARSSLLNILCGGPNGSNYKDLVIKFVS